MHDTSQSMIVSKHTLSPCAISVLGQLFVEGPTLDNNVASKAGRCDLVNAGLAFLESGWASLTPEGLRLATEWDLASLYARRDRRWYLKARSEMEGRARGEEMRLVSPTQFGSQALAKP